jgi:hypothetical protein
LADILKFAPFDENGHANWRKSSAREYLNSKFLTQLADNRRKEGALPSMDLLSYISSLTADDGLMSYGFCQDLVFLLSSEDYRRNSRSISNLKNKWWLLTPHSNHICSMHLIDIFGNLVFESADINYDIGLRPAIYLRKNTEVKTKEVLD